MLAANELPRRRAYEVLEARPLRYKNQDTRQNNPMRCMVTIYKATLDARPTGNGRAEPQGILLIKASSWNP